MIQTDDQPKTVPFPNRDLPHRSIRSQLLLPVNATIAILVVVFVAYDYQREFGERLKEKHIALEEESKTILPAIARLRHHGLDAVQKYLDAVCVRMQDTQSPGHHIAVQLETTILQTSSHNRASQGISEAMRRASQSADHRTLWGETELVVGDYRQDGLSVYVSEDVRSVRRSVIGNVLRRVSGLFVLAIASALIVNLVLNRIVVTPVDQLVTTVQSIAKGKLGVQAGTFRSAELSYLADAINTMSLSLAAADRERMVQMAKAQEIQQHLLPKICNTPGLRVAHAYQPADGVAGDFYDVLSLQDHSWLVCVADVTGHGVPAAMSAAMLKTLLLDATERLTRPDEILSFINQRFTKVTLLGDFATMFVARLDLQAEILEYASAGHETAWSVPRDGKLRPLPSTGMVLGIDVNTIWERKTLSIARGERLLAVTDGVTEAANSQGKCFGRERLAQLFSSCRDLALEPTEKRIEQAVNAHREDAPVHDDLTLLLVEFFSNDEFLSNDEGKRRQILQA